MYNTRRCIYVEIGPREGQKELPAGRRLLINVYVIKLCCR